MPCKSNSQAHSPYFHGFPSCSLQALGRSCSSCNKTLAKWRALRGDKMVWLVLSEHFETAVVFAVWELWRYPSTQPAASPGVEGREAGWTSGNVVLYTDINYEAQAEIKAQPATKNISMGGAWGHFSMVFRITQHLCRMLWKIVSKTLSIFERPWVEWWKGLTGREKHEFWRHFQIPGVPSAPHCWPLTPGVYQHVH